MNKISARLYSYLLVLKEYVFSTSLTFAIAVTPSVTSVAPQSCPIDQTLTEVGCLPKDPIQFISSFYTLGLGLIGGVSLLFIMIGGYTIMTSRGNASQVNVGKSYIFYAIAGLLLAIFGYLFIEVLTVDILHIPGFGH